MPVYVEDSDLLVIFYISISYTNGAVEYDEERGYYIPVSLDGIVKDGADLPVAAGVYCGECYEEYICID